MPDRSLNVLLVLADQLVPFLTGAYGHPVVQTPARRRVATTSSRSRSSARSTSCRRAASPSARTILDARALRLVLHGGDKRAAASRLLGLDRFDRQWPASIVHEHPDAEILVDRSAAP